MTERTLQHLARELAGMFYDSVRSAESLDHKVQIERRGRVLLQIDPKLFAKTFPTVDDYISGYRHGQVRRDWESGITTHVDDGKVYQDVPGWRHWYDSARSIAVDMLNSATTHPNIKEAIIESLIEDREKQLKVEQGQGQFAQVPQGKLH